MIVAYHVVKFDLLGSCLHTSALIIGFAARCRANEERQPREPSFSVAFENTGVKPSTSTHPTVEEKNESQASATTRRTSPPHEKLASTAAQTRLAACDDACNLALNERILVPDPDPGKLAICPVTALVGAFWNVAVRASGIRA